MDDRHILIDAATIDCIEVSDKVVIVQTAEQTYRARETLNRIERWLPSGATGRRVFQRRMA